jgi:hypothetical protein
MPPTPALPSDDISTEWLENVIHGNIRRRMDGVRINPIQLSGAGAGRVLYVRSFRYALLPQRLMTEV